MPDPLATFSYSLPRDDAFQAVIDAYGEWTAMSVHLGGDEYTREPAVDHRLRRLVQCACDISKKPIAQCRVLDLACLEGHYAIEFAAHGAKAVAIEGREANIAKARYVKDRLNLSKLELHTDDVRNLSLAKYGEFDIVICSGILYHLQDPDAFEFLASIAEVCKGIVLFDTFVALSGQTSVAYNGGQISGLKYFEHYENDTEEDKKIQLWASIDNTYSYWMTQPSFINLLADNGFTSFHQVLLPTMPNTGDDRRTYVAIKGRREAVKTSPMTDSQPNVRAPEVELTPIDRIQTKRSALFRFTKRVLPPSIKEVIKPGLRLVGLLPKDPTPDFIKKAREKQERS